MDLSDQGSNTDQNEDMCVGHCISDRSTGLRTPLHGSDELEARRVVGVPGPPDVGLPLPVHHGGQAKHGGGGEDAHHHASLLPAVHLALPVPPLLVHRPLLLRAARAGLHLHRRRGGRRGLHLLLFVILVVVVAAFLVGGARGGGGRGGGAQGRRRRRGVRRGGSLGGGRLGGRRRGRRRRLLLILAGGERGGGGQGGGRSGSVGVVVVVGVGLGAEERGRGGRAGRRRLRDGALRGRHHHEEQEADQGGQLQCHHVAPGDRDRGRRWRRRRGGADLGAAARWAGLVVR
ncbi:mucin-1-like [Hordeum vulgare]|nr:mucin-1-like [Hordeum vulgare]